MHNEDTVSQAMPKKSFISASKVMISQIVQNQRLKFDMGHFVVISLKILHLKIQKDGKIYDHTLISTR